MAKVFIGCVTYAKHAYALQYFLDSLAAFTKDDNIEWDLFFVDTTSAGCPELAPYTQLREDCNARLSGRKVTFLETTVTPGTYFIEIIARARQQLQQEFLKHPDYTHFFMVDSDMVFPNDALQILLSNNYPIVTGVYLGIQNHETDTGIKQSLSPVAYIQDPVVADRARPLMTIDILMARKIPILITGFGVVLMRRDVIEAVPFPYDPSNNITAEDTPVYLEFHRRGIPVIMDTRVKCAHLKFPIGDARNKLLDFANYQIKVKTKS